MSTALEFDVEKYGTYARFSALADALECMAIGGAPMTEADLADRIRDSNWHFPRHFILPADVAAEASSDFEDEDEGLEVSREHSRAVFALLEEREQALGAAYPFKFENGRLGVKSRSQLRTAPYAALLAITVCHSYELAAPHKPTTIFEDTVSSSLEAHARGVINFSRARSSASSFDAGLKTVGAELKLPTDSSGAVKARYAKDENVDVIARLVFSDGRAGAWTIIGQATCAKSDHWESKLVEPAADLWRSYLGCYAPPSIFLAVPHHVQAEHLARLISNRGALVLDRLRLASMKATNSGEESALIDALLDVTMSFA